MNEGRNPERDRHRRFVSIPTPIYLRLQARARELGIPVRTIVAGLVAAHTPEPAPAERDAP